MIPPAARKESTVIPKNSKRSEPLHTTISRVIATAPAQVHAIRVAWLAGRLAVMAATTPVLPIGFIMEKRAATRLVRAASGITCVTLFVFLDEGFRPLTSEFVADRPRELIASGELHAAAVSIGHISSDLVIRGKYATDVIGMP